MSKCVWEVCPIEPVKFPIDITTCGSDRGWELDLRASTVECDEKCSFIFYKSILTIRTISCLSVASKCLRRRKIMDEIVEFSFVFQELIHLRILSWPVDIELFAVDTICISTRIPLHESDRMRKKRKSEKEDEEKKFFHRWGNMRNGGNAKKREVRGRKIFSKGVYWMVSDWEINFYDNEIRSFSAFA